MSDQPMQPDPAGETFDEGGGTVEEGKAPPKPDAPAQERQPKTAG